MGIPQQSPNGSAKKDTRSNPVSKTIRLIWTPLITAMVFAFIYIWCVGMEAGLPKWSNHGADEYLYLLLPVFLPLIILCALFIMSRVRTKNQFRIGLFIIAALNLIIPIYVITVDIIANIPK